MKRYTEEFKQQILSELNDGLTVNEIREKYGVARSSVFLWVKERTPDAQGQVPRERYLLEKELERLRKENEVFKICGCSPASPLPVRLDAIAAHADQFSIHMLCDLLGVNRSAYYYHIRYAPAKTQLELEDERLRPLILDIFEKSGHRFGARKIRAKLMQDGHTVSERRVHRLMHELHLAPDESKPKLNSANDRQYQYYPNKLKRKFLTDAPNKIWVSDITYVKVGFDFMYLCVIVDLYARKVVGYAISENIDADLTMNTFRQAFASRGKPADLLFHSDQGVQYTAAAFRNLLRRSGVRQSFSAPGSPHDNAVAESFFASIKKEDFRRNFYTTAEELQEAVDDYVQFYNDYRPHQRLGYLTPNQAEADYAAQKMNTENR